jgi:aspartate/methionine/tyrosine aminotransferase
VATFAQRRAVIVGALNELPGFRCAMPGGAFYAFPSIAGTGRGSRALEEELLGEAGVATISGTSFGLHGEGYLRFSYAASTEAIEEACERIGRHLRR